MIVVATLVCAALPAIDVPMASASTQAPTVAGLDRGLVAASAQAQATDAPVGVPDQTTETSTVTADPDGSYTMVSSLTPVRVEQNGVWTPIDTDLHRNSDGSLSPDATTEDVTFSGGGSVPAVTLIDGADSVSLTLPTTLPVPTINGPTATYASVLPGVDLELTATANSYTEVLVVHSAAAAANPALRSLTFTVTTVGLKAAGDGRGGITVTDDTGAEVFQGSQPTMWNSSYSAAAGAPPSATGPGGADVTAIPVTLPTADGTAGTPNTSTMTLAVPSTELTGPGVTYPVFIDPSLDEPHNHFAVVTTDNNWHYYDDTSNDLKVGDCDWGECHGTWKARTLLAFDTDPLTDQPTIAHVSAASVQVYEIHSAHACTAEPVQLFSSDSRIDSSTVWPGPSGTELDQEPSNYGNDCAKYPAGDVTFANSNVVGQFQRAANINIDHLTFGLRAPDESDRYQWKRFSSAGGSAGAAAQITVKYDFPPSKPYDLAIGGAVRCGGHPTYVRSATPTFSARARDYDPGAVQVAHHFALFNSAGHDVRNNPAGVLADSDAVAVWSTGSSNSNAAGPVAQGAYRVQDRASSASPDTADTYGAVSDWLPFTVDTVPPSVPAISSFDYPQNTWGSYSGGTFTLSGSAARPASPIPTTAAAPSRFPAIRSALTPRRHAQPAVR